MQKAGRSWWYKNSLSVALLALFLLSFTGQIYNGIREYNAERLEDNADPVSLGRYLKSGHFLQSTFENWESEFLQMAAYIVLTISLRQIGSSESKPLDKEDAVDREPDPRREGAPWPVRKGGLSLILYRNSLSLVFAFLFVASFMMHMYGSHKDFNEEQMRKKTAAKIIPGLSGRVPAMVRIVSELAKRVRLRCRHRGAVHLLPSKRFSRIQTRRCSAHGNRSLMAGRPGNDVRFGRPRGMAARVHGETRLVFKICAAFLNFASFFNFTGMYKKSLKNHETFFSADAYSKVSCVVPVGDDAFYGSRHRGVGGDPVYALQKYLGLSGTVD